MSRVDVIIPCYNYGDMLAACVASVLSQEGVDVRVLIVDDASTDITEEVGTELALRDQRVEFWRHPVNCGHIATYNEALAWVTGDYCMILSADDVLTSRSLLRATAVMDAHPEIGFTYGRDVPFRHAPPVEKTASPRSAPHRSYSYAEFLERSCRLGQTGIQSPTVLVRSSVHRAAGGYLPELPHSGDTEIWLRFAALSKVAEINADQAFRRLHARNMSLDYSPLSRLEEQKKAFDTHFETCPQSKPFAAALRPVVSRTIADGAFWTAARAFEAGNENDCNTFLTFALWLAPRIEQTAAFKRLQWKRRLGHSRWRFVQPILDRVRILRTVRSHG